MAGKRKLNVRLLRRIQRHILEEPRRFQMDAEIIQAKTQHQWLNCITFFSRDASKTMPPCGTAACIAGWANILSDIQLRGREGRNSAADLLGIEAGNSWCHHPLFFARNWPEPYATRYKNAKTPKLRAKIAAARIEHLIKTKGAE